MSWQKTSLFDKLNHSNFDEIQKLSNTKERAYLDLISSMKAEHQEFKEKSKKIILRLQDELKKAKAKSA